MLEAGTFPTNRPQTGQHTQLPGMIALPPRPISAGDEVVCNMSALNAGLMPPPPPPPPRNHFVNSTGIYGQADSTTSQLRVPPHTIEGVDGNPLAAAHNGLIPSHTTTKYALGNPTGATLGDRPATIDTYTPRPSTAPSKVSQHLSQVLPPMRELPFKRTRVKGLPLAENAPVSAEEEAVEHPAPGSPTMHEDTIIPDSQVTSVVKQSKVSNKAVASKKKIAKLPAKPTKGKTATQPRSQKCDACK